MDTPLTTQLLKRFVPLDSLKRKNLDALCRKTQVAMADQGKTLLKEGESDQRLIYLVSGNLILTTPDGTIEVIESHSVKARRPISESLPREHTVTAGTAVEYISLDADLLDVMLTWDQAGAYEVNDLRSLDNEPGQSHWMTALLQTRAFRNIPAVNIQAIFMRLEEIDYRAGDLVIKQGDEGDFFYIITAGTCAVTRETPLNRDGIRLAELAAGDTFGEEALITESKRNATVSMLTSGKVMRLSKANFQVLLKEPSIERVDYSEAQVIIANGGKWLDARLPSEFEPSHQAGAINIPLYVIRLKLGNLDPDTQYVVYCDTGRRSSAAAFILIEKGFNACVLHDGTKRVDA